jgi:uncharacterized protein (DUF2384 family)
MDDFTQLIRTRIPVKSVDVMMHTAGLSKEELLVPIGISKATFDRRKQQTRFEAFKCYEFSGRTAQISH